MYARTQNAHSSPDSLNFWKAVLVCYTFLNVLIEHFALVTNVVEVLQTF
jgi:hypothetical protein